MNPFVEGMILGLTLAVLLGPALFALIQTGIHRGFFPGSLLATGIFISDLALLVLCFFGAFQILYDGYNRLFFGIISGLILIAYGIATFTRKIHIDNENDMVNNKKPGWFTYILKGFFMNIANPFVWIFWMGVTVGITSNYGDETGEVMSFLGGVLFTIFTTDLIKVYIAKKIKGFLKPENVRKINKFVGIMLMCFGVFLMVRILAYHFQWIS